MRVTLVLCPQANPDKPPLSLAYLAANLIAQGIDVRCFDLNIELFSKQPAEKKKLWESMMEPLWFDIERLKDAGLISDSIFDDWVEKIEKTAPEIVGFSLLATTYHVTTRIAEKLKNRNPNLKIVFGGPEVYRLFGLGNLDVLNCADALILGEGEETLVKAALSLKEKGHFVAGEGILTREGKKFTGEENIQLICPLDVISFPKYELFPLELYKERGQLPLIFSRGCVGRCTFCFERAYWKKFRQRSVDNVIREIQSIRERFGVYCFSLNDSLLNGDMSFLKEFCERVIGEKIRVQWWGMARVDGRMSEEFIRKMKRAGCQSLAYGVESGSQRVLDLMRKDCSVSLIDDVITNTWKAGIKPGINLLLGFPGEEEIDFQQTCELVKRHGEHIAYVNISTLGIEPFTDVHARRHELGINLLDTSHWQTADGKNDSKLRRERAERLSEIIGRYVGKANNFADEQ